MVERQLPMSRVSYRTQSGTRSLAPRNSTSLTAWIILAGAVLPTETQFRLGGAKLTSGRIGILLLLLPAIVALCQKGRRSQVCDLFAVATGIWMILSASLADGMDSLPSAGAESLEFLGAYLVGRAF